MSSSVSEGGRSLEEAVSSHCLMAFNLYAPIALRPRISPPAPSDVALARPDVVVPPTPSPPPRRVLNSSTITVTPSHDRRATPAPPSYLLLEKTRRSRESSRPVPFGAGARCWLWNSDVVVGVACLISHAPPRSMGQSASSHTLQQLADEETSRPVPASLAELESDMYSDAPATFEFQPPAVPFDHEGFVRAFYPPPPLDGLPDAAAHRPERYDSVADIQAFFDEFGFVVIRDVVSREMLDGVRRELWSKPGLEGLDATDANSWIKADWNQVFGGSYNERHGFVGFAIGESQAAQDVRQLPAMHRSFAAVYRVPDLWFKYDRFGLMRPTRDIKITRRTERELQWAADMADARALLFDEAPIGAAAAASSLLAREQLSHEPGDDEIVTMYVARSLALYYRTGISFDMCMYVL